MFDYNYFYFSILVIKRVIHDAEMKITDLMLK